ncbi:MAG: DnaB-like helicase C-terminal domain-containing protein, partial [Candidatus Auribacterota bacterium]|nr:DnaB-like helicase C-terminal domain-containing protein [Candidatus Auribacterota bacterium]
LQPAELIVLAGRPSMGKTAFALNMAEYIALKEKKGVGIFSLEMSSAALGRRMLCCNARVDAQNLRRGFISTKDSVKLAHSAGRLSEAGIWIDDRPGATNLELRARARDMKARFDIDLLVVDYLQLMQATTGRTESRQQEVSDISRSLKALARELNIPILVLSQLNRGPEDRPDRRPRLADLRESGAIEQDADLVIMIMRPGAYPDLIENDPSLENMVLVNIAKQRNGPTGEIKLTFIKRYTRFEDYAEPEE